MSHRRRRRQSFALLAAFAVLTGTAACAGTQGGARPDPANERRWTLPTARPDEPTTAAGDRESPLGLKWNWAQRATLSFAEQVPGGATFLETEWCAVEPEPGRRLWTRVDQAVDRAQAMGYETLLKIRTGSCWATERGPGGVFDVFERSTRKSSSSSPRDMRAYRDYVRAFARRYAARGVHLYAVENEIDTRNFWTADFGAYQDLVRSAAAVIHEVDPDATVLDAGISSTAYGVAIAGALLDDGRAEEALDFYSAYYARRQAGDASRFPIVRDTAHLRAVVDSPAGRRSREAFAATFELARSGAIDAFQLHFYEPWQLLPEVLGWVRSSLPASMPVQAWEVGIAWPGESYDPRASATETARLLGTLLARGVTRAVYLPLAYTPGTGREEIFRGLVEQDGTALPAAAAYRCLMRASAGSRSASPPGVDGVSGVAFNRGSSTSFVLWSERPVRLRVAAPAGAAATDLSGQRLDWSPAGLDVGSAPVVVTWPAPLSAARASLAGTVAAAD